MTRRPARYARLVLWNLAKLIRMKKSLGFVFFRIIRNETPECKIERENIGRFPRNIETYIQICLILPQNGSFNWGNHTIKKYFFLWVISSITPPCGICWKLLCVFMAKAMTKRFQQSLRKRYSVVLKKQWNIKAIRQTCKQTLNLAVSLN